MIDYSSLSRQELEERMRACESERNKLRAAAEHWQEQAGERYVYLIGEWQGARRAKRTDNGVFVPSQEVIDYLS